MPPRALADGLALPLGDARQHVQHEAARRRAGVDLLAHADEPQPAICEVALHQRAHVADRSREPIELRNDDAAALP